MENNQEKKRSRSLHIQKTLPADIRSVWQAWTEPEKVMQWWGPDGFHTTIQVMEVQAGGLWRLVLQGPDGKRYPNKSLFEEIVPLQKIVFRHFNPNYYATILFDAREKETVIDWTNEFETKELFETVVKVFKADESLLQNVRRLETYLTSPDNMLHYL